MAEVTPITLLIGEAGSGKSTILHHLLRQPGGERVAGIVYRPGALRSDLAAVQAGCPCCGPARSDLLASLRALLPRARRDEIVHVIVNVASRSDPSTIRALLSADPVAASAYHVVGVVAVLDATRGVSDGAIRFAGAADRIIVSKTDMAEAGDLPGLARGRPVAFGKIGALDFNFVLSAERWEVQ